MENLKRYVFYSALGHIIALLLATIVSSLCSTGGKFIVFGAYSGKPTKTIWKNNTVPFLNGRSWHGNKNGKSGKNKLQKSINKNRSKKGSKHISKTQEKKEKQTALNKRKTQKAQKSPPQKKLLNKKSLAESVSVKNKHKKLLVSSKISHKLIKSNSHAIAIAKQEKIPSYSSKKQAIEPKNKKIDLKTDDTTQAPLIKLPQVNKEEKQEKPLKEETTGVFSKKTALFEEEGEEEEEGESQQGNDDENIGFNFIDGNTAQEEVVVFQQYIQQEVDRLWHPPLGVPKGTVCTILFDIDINGKAKECSLVKRSPMLIYDLSIMRVAKKINFHESVWGKKFKIDFRQ